MKPIMQDLIILIIIGFVIFFQVKYFNENRKKILNYKKSVDEINSLEIKKINHDRLDPKDELNNSENEYNDTNTEYFASEVLKDNIKENEIPNYEDFKKHFGSL